MPSLLYREETDSRMELQRSLKTHQGLLHTKVSRAIKDSRYKEIVIDDELSIRKCFEYHFKRDALILM